HLAGKGGKWGKRGMHWFLAEPRSMLHLSCHFPGTLPMNKRGKIEKMTAGEIFAVV
ncbi:hypothetical protein JOQ06_008890, partial [Pogonophryne albipinna]